MPRYKNGAFKKKAGRFRAAAATLPPQNATKHTGGGRPQPSRRDADLDFGSSTRSGTSMQQLALNTRNVASHWDQGSRLRDRPVSFVSGGFVEPLTELEQSENPIPTAKTTTTNVPSDDAEDPKHSCDINPDNVVTKPLTTPEVDALNESSTMPGAVDVDSDSSDEVILFRGRGGIKGPGPALIGGTALEDTQSSMETAVPVHSAPPTVIPSSPQMSDRLGLLLVDSGDDAGSDAAIDDYIANMDGDDMADMISQLALNRRDLGGAHNGVVIDTTNGNDDETTDDQDDDGSDLSKEEQGGEEIMSGSESDHPDQPWQMAAEVDDEQLARLLAKQEELGIGSDELILFDDVSVGAAPKMQASRPGKQPKRSRGPNPWKQIVSPGYGLAKGLRTSDEPYPSAGAVADAFEQLEVSGWTDKHGEFQFEMSDSDIEATLQASWKKDRARKKEKKKAREQLRAEGLLGKHANPSDPRVKYPDGMGLDDVKAEFQSFLLGSENSIALSPMDAHARKIIHELAHRFNITSKSTGSGNQRRPTLIRTKSTARFNEEQFHSIFAKYRRRFFARLDGNRGDSKKAAGHRQGDPAAATVRNGEVVGGSAPEIGQANKGRTMLERMGWSMGMALGAMDNQGMTQPIAHVVKRSKAGLG